MAKSTIKASKSSIKPGESNTITITRSSSSYTHTIKYTVGKLSGTVVTKTTSTSVKVTVPLDAIIQSPNKSQTCTITCTTYNGSSSLGSTTCTFTVAPYSPNTIISAGFTDGNLGSTINVTVEKSNSNFTSTLNYSFEGSSIISIASKSTATDFALTPTVDLASYIPDKQYGTLIIRIGTFYKDTKVGATQTFTMTLEVPKEVKPTITATGWVDTSGYADKYGAPVASKSTIMLTSTAKGIYDSHIATVYYAVNSISKTYTNKNADELSKDTLSSEMQFPKDVISWTADNFVYSITAEDTRGHLSDTVFKEDIAVLSYKAPQIRHSFYRCDASGNKLEDGTYVKFSFIHAFSSLNNKNTKHVNIYRDNTKIYSGELETYNSSAVIVTSGWGRDVAYTFKIELVDDFSTTAVTGKIEPVFSLINFKADGTGIAFGDVSTRSNSIEMGMPVYIKKAISFDSTGGNSAIYASGNNLYIGTSAANSYVTIADAASANGTDKWLLSSDGKFSISQGVCVGANGAFSGLDSNGAEHRLIGISGSGNVFINPIEDGVGSTNIYGGANNLVQLGSTSAPVDVRHNGHDIYDTVYNRSTTTTSVPNNAWTTLTAKVTLHKGLWIILSKVQFSSASGKRRGIRIYNSTDAESYSISQTVVGGSSTSGGIMVNTMVVQDIAATKIYTVQAYQDTGAAVNVTESILQAVCIG